MKISLKQISSVTSNETLIRARCPNCRQRGAFENTLTHELLLQSGSNRLILGSRRCPDPLCHQFLFVVAVYNAGDLLASYPAETIDFDASDIPQRIVEALGEAITCHSNTCYTAAAIMVRKALEYLCDEQDAKGGNLMARIEDLKSKITLPTELLASLHELRLLGNDAAHLENKVYDNVGKDEVEAAIELAKEILKAIYQYKKLVSRLQGLKKPTE